MISQERIMEAEKNVKKYIEDSWLFNKRKDIPQYTKFFIKNAETSLLTAKILSELSLDISKKQTLDLQEEFESYLWVIVSSYYAMFYSALALFAKNEIKVGDKLVHKVTADVLIANFLRNKKLAKLLEDFEETKGQALQITGTEQKAEQLIQNFEYERHKRNSTQYELGTIAKQNLAQTSLQRAEQFVAEIRKTLKE